MKPSKPYYKHACLNGEFDLPPTKTTQSLSPALLHVIGRSRLRHNTEKTKVK